MSIEEIVENIGLPPKDEVKPKRKHETRKLYWYERQYGAGFMNGLWTGLAAGFVVVPLVAAGCKAFLEWLFAFAG